MIAFTTSLPVSLHGRHAPGISHLACRPRAISARASPRRARRIVPTMVGDPSAPDGNTITQALEVTFRAVWLRLMTAGVGDEYAQAIEQFVVACVAAYKAGYSLTALKFELSANEPDDKEAKVMGRDIRLSSTEKDTRLIWIALVYMTLARFRFSPESAPVSVERDLEGTQLGQIARGLAGLVDSVAAAAKRGYNLQTYKMELNLAEPAGVEQSAGKTPQTAAAEKSLRSQWSRIVFTTIGILPEALKGFNGGKA